MADAGHVCRWFEATKEVGTVVPSSAENTMRCKERSERNPRPIPIWQCMQSTVEYYGETSCKAYQLLERVYVEDKAERSATQRMAN